MISKERMVPDIIIIGFVSQSLLRIRAIQPNKERRHYYQIYNQMHLHACVQILNTLHPSPLTQNNHNQLIIIKSIHSNNNKISQCPSPPFLQSGV